jgi:hypothetical protein
VIGPLAVLVLMLGFGLRLDSDWQTLAALVLLAGAVLAAVGLGNAFVRDDPVR